MISSTQLRPAKGSRPFVAVVSAVPLPAEAMAFSLDLAQVGSFSAAGGYINGLQGLLRPDALIVSSEAAAKKALECAREYEPPVQHVSVHAHALRPFRSRGVGNGFGPGAEMIRKVLAGVLFARAGSAQ